MLCFFSVPDKERETERDGEETSEAKRRMRSEGLRKGEKKGEIYSDRERKAKIRRNIGFFLN